MAVTLNTRGRSRERVVSHIWREKSLLRMAEAVVWIKAPSRERFCLSLPTAAYVTQHDPVVK